MGEDKAIYAAVATFAATFAAAMSENIKLLIPSRKMSAVRQLLAYLQQSVDVGDKCLAPLKDETEAIYRSWLWKTLFLSHRTSERTRERSAGGAT